jgi:hypothetical protein
MHTYIPWIHKSVEVTTGCGIRHNIQIYSYTDYRILHFGIKLFNHLPSNIKELAHNIKQFTVALSAFLHSKSFYTLEEYFSQG